MISIYKRELASFYKNLTGWLFGAALLFFAGLYTVIVNFSMGRPNFEYTLNNLSFVYIVMIPVLTMRSFSEEKKLRTDRLLYSLPVRMSQVVLGKYLALLTVLLLPTLVLLLYPLLLRSLGAASLRAAYASVIGFFLLGAALTAIGMFLSTLSESPAISAGCGVAVFLLLYFSADLAGFLPSGANASFAALIISILVLAALLWLYTRSVMLAAVPSGILLAALCIWHAGDPYAFIGLFPEIISRTALFNRYYEFANAVLDLRTILLFISVAAVFLFLAEQSLEGKRWNG